MLYWLSEPKTSQARIQKIPVGIYGIYKRLVPVVVILLSRRRCIFLLRSPRLSSFSRKMGHYYLTSLLFDVTHFSVIPTLLIITARLGV